jgi:hypothetical protein
VAPPPNATMYFALPVWACTTGWVTGCRAYGWQFGQLCQACAWFLVGVRCIHMRRKGHCTFMVNLCSPCPRWWIRINVQASSNAVITIVMCGHPVEKAQCFVPRGCQACQGDIC